MSLNLALVDAASNCARDGATAVVTLRSGVVIMGKLQRSLDGVGTVLLTTPTGWVTVVIDEIAAVEARRV